jgi:hypothetical protein
MQKNPTEHEWNALSAEFPEPFLTHVSPASLPDGSGCWIRMIRMSVLGQQTSHLLLIRTNFGYGTALTAACARQGFSTTDYYCYYVM